MGTNDSNTAKLVPLDKYAGNLKDMVNLAKERDIKTVLVGPAAHDNFAGIEDDTRTNSLNLKYSLKAEQVSKELGVPFVDLWSGFMTKVGWRPGQDVDGKYLELKDLLVDGIHFAGAGYKIFYVELSKAIAQAYPELTADNMAWRFPPVQDIDSDHPEDSIKIWFEKRDKGEAIYLGPNLGYKQ
jgi:lysophospholipase L1-like esterase